MRFLPCCVYQLDFGVIFIQDSKVSSLCVAASGFNLLYFGYLHLRVNIFDLQTSFSALTKEPDAGKKLNFIEQRVKTWVSEVIEGHDGLSVQAHLLTKRVNGLIEGTTLEPE